MKSRIGVRPVGVFAAVSIFGALGACGNDPAFTNQTSEITPERAPVAESPSKRDSDAVGAEIDGNAVIDAGSGGGVLVPGMPGDGSGAGTGNASGSGDGDGNGTGEGSGAGSGSGAGAGGLGSGSAGSSGGGSGGSVGGGSAGGGAGMTPNPVPTTAPAPKPTARPVPTPVADSSDDNLSDSEAAARDDAVDKVQAACASKPRVKRTVPLAFAKSAVDSKSICTWSSSPTNNVIRGYAAQSARVVLPDGALLCSSRISSDPRGTWVYDDEVVLTMNDVVLFSSQKEYLRKDDANVMPRVGGGYGFEWAKLEKLAYANVHSVDSDRYCYGGLASKECVIPTSEKVGAVRLDLPSAALAPLALKAQADKKVEFKLWVTGDNDVKIDCKHSGITLSGEFEYVMP